MKKLALYLLLGFSLHAADPCTIDIGAIYADTGLVITTNADGTQTIDDADYEAWWQYIYAVTAAAGN